MKYHRLLAILWSLALASSLSAADLKLAALFSDHMVLQREKAVPVWGWADPDEKVTVTFGGQTKAATADAAGKWLVRLDPMPASAESRELVDVYQKKVAATCGPLPAGHKVKGSEVTMAFSHVDGGLRAREGELTGFEIAAADRAWKPAVARIEGDKVVVSQPDVAKPVAVRYAWTANPTCNLINGAGLPASPFRTDDWPAVTPPTPASR